MKIQLTYDRPTEIATDLLAVILDDEHTFHDLGSSPLQETVRRIQREFKDKKLKTDYFTSLEAKSGPRNLVVFWTGLNKSFNIWELVKTFTSRAIRMAHDRGLQKVVIALNTQDAVAFVGKAVEGAILGTYTFDRYKKDKIDISKVVVQLAALKEHDGKNRHHVDRYTLVSNAVNEARDLVNEPGSTVVPETLAEAAKTIAREADLQCTVWDEKRLRKEGYNGLIQVGKGSVHPPRMIRLTYRNKKAKHHLAFVGKGITFDTGGISIKPADKMWEMKG